MYKKIGKSCDKINASSKSDGALIIINSHQPVSDQNIISGETKKGKSESDYQRIADATSQNVKGLLHESKSSPSSPKCKNKMKLQQRQKKPKVYPYSDGEDNVFYSMNDSADSLSTSSRRSSYDGQDKTFVVVVSKKSNKNMTLAQKQRSWETFPPKRRNHMCQKLSAPMPLKKADSFEGCLTKFVRFELLYVSFRSRGGGKESSGCGAGNQKKTKRRQLTKGNRRRRFWVLENIDVCQIPRKTVNVGVSSTP